ncbi:uncharacterized protein LOC107815455 isoform X4 [Nicotiana tabacum]|uniref:Uncharacterized protein LOC107815455 isoform X4 n=2 Tax=Nicotiana TaxID=4085 RepID=A0A1S4C5N4_TOBAC|nr:PREDICTED: uncharacterized protein LOC104225590 isoform X4 [Nicotiana sylvestris]XP_016496521.1 PREDICTED: uncharacterized protein LOC107815455 isoform X3 [Nicotiana tabacum]
MVMLCFVLDLRSLSAPLLRDLKQSMLQLANFYAISSPSSSTDSSRSKPLLDRIGLCYVFKNRISRTDELKIAYSARGNFNLRDFHHAVNNLPSDAFLPDFNSSGALCISDLKLCSILNDKVLYSWGGHNKDITRKVILISSCIFESLDSATKKALMDAADNCVSIEFIFLEQNSSHLADTLGSINKFLKQIGDLENCAFQNYIPDAHALSGLVKKWFQELKEAMEEQLQARFVFKSNLLGSTNQISCNLCTSFNQIIDELVPCKSCRCHGIPFDNSKMIRTGKSSCPVTGVELGALDLVESSVKIGEHTILYMPSFQCSRDLQKVPLPINFDVIERTNLRSLDEGIILGTSYIVTPALFELDDTDKSELNAKLFQVLCGVLHSLDQGLVCSSKCNVETAKQTSFLCYYILLPSEKGVMILRIELRNYDPVQHERGFHQRLNLLVKESLQFGAIPAKAKEPVTATNIAQQDPMIEDLSDQANNLLVIGDNVLDSKTTDGKIGTRITEEWEQLVVLEIPKMSSPTCISKPKLDKEVSSPPKTTGKLDDKTSRILERLEVPKQLQRKATSPTVSSSSVKTPLIPFGRGITDAKAIVSSQPIKPNFQRLKRKR